MCQSVWDQPVSTSVNQCETLLRRSAVTKLDDPVWRNLKLVSYYKTNRCKSGWHVVDRSNQEKEVGDRSLLWQAPNYVGSVWMEILHWKRAFLESKAESSRSYCAEGRFKKNMEWVQNYTHNTKWNSLFTHYIMPSLKVTSKKNIFYRTQVSLVRSMCLVLWNEGTSSEKYGIMWE